MKLNEEGLKNREQWEKKGYRIPQYDRAKVTTATREHPQWVHFGAGSLFRAFHANIAQRLLDAGEIDRGIIAVEGFDGEIVERVNVPHDNYSILVTLKSDGTVEKIVIGSVVESLAMTVGNEAAFAQMKEIFAKESLQMATFTITEKGYSLVDGSGVQRTEVEADFAAGPKSPISYLGKVAALLYHRYQSGAYPIALVSTDNCSHNGEKLSAAVTAFAQAWEKNALVEPGFLEYIRDKHKVSFPWSMIDKITPNPDESVAKLLEEDGVEEAAPFVTAKHTHTALFVNAEETEYLVIEDDFPNGRPPLEKGGVMLASREVVEKVERMKVCTCLNPLHTALAVFGCLFGYTKISEAMNDVELLQLVEDIGYKEGLPVAADPGIIRPKRFLDTVLRVRMPNPFLPDSPQRIATDTSQKLAVRFGETIKAYANSEDYQPHRLTQIPLVFAGWLRYLMGIDDNGKPFELSPDPMLGTLRAYVEWLKLEEGQDVESAVGELLRNKQIFGVDLYEVGLAETVCAYLKEMTAGVGAVRKTLENHV